MLLVLCLGHVGVGFHRVGVVQCAAFVVVGSRGVLLFTPTGTYRAPPSPFFFDDGVVLCTPRLLAIVAQP